MYTTAKGPRLSAISRMLFTPRAYPSFPTRTTPTGFRVVAGQEPAIDLACRSTSRTMAGVSMPVKVFRWLTW